MNRRQPDFVRNAVAIGGTIMAPFCSHGSELTGGAGPRARVTALCAANADADAEAKADADTDADAEAEPANHADTAAFGGFGDFGSW